MGEKFTFRVLLRDLLIGIFASLIGSVFISMFFPRLWVLLILGVFLIFFVLWLRYRRAIKVIRSGTVAYYYSFEISENPKVWSEVKHDFLYLGISCDSIMRSFEDWINKNPHLNFRILLMKPNSKALRKQEAYLIGHDIEENLDDLPSETKELLDKAVKATSQRIQGAISRLKQTSAYRQGCLKIKLYDEFTPWWVYLIDGKKMYVGVLEKGKPGIDSPVLVFEKRAKYFGPFDAFENHLKRMWEEAKEV